MDEIRERVTLTNATDEAMFRRGELASSKVRKLTVDGVVNIDPVRSIIPQRVAQIPGVTIRNGRTVGPILFECCGGQAIDEALIGDESVIIGRTVVAKIRSSQGIRPDFELTES